MSIQLESLPLPPSANPAHFADFGKEVKGVHPGELTPEQFKEIEQLLYKVCEPRYYFVLIFLTFVGCKQHSVLLFRDAVVSPEQQYALTKVVLYIVKSFQGSYSSYIA